jgi:hypothetical protein
MKNQLNSISQQLNVASPVWTQAIADLECPLTHGCEKA